MKKKDNIQTQSDLLMTRIYDFFTHEEHIKRMIDILTGKSVLSLRIIDWFVTNYSQKYNVVYSYKKNNYNDINELDFDKNTETIDDIHHIKFLVYFEYKSQLTAYSKKQFDCFCRGERLKYQYTYQQTKYEIETTVGQLNFFRWAIQNNLFVYIINNYIDIEKDMNNTIHQKKIKKKDGESKRVLYHNQSSAYSKTNMKIMVYFN